MVLRSGTGMNRDMKGLGFETHHRAVGFIYTLPAQVLLQIAAFLHKCYIILVKTMLAF